jgi:hypothetical protein
MAPRHVRDANRKKRRGGELPAPPLAVVVSIVRVGEGHAWGTLQ